MTQEELLQAILEETRKNNSSSPTAPSAPGVSRLPGAKDIDSALGAMKNSIAQGGGSISDFSRGVESLVPNIPLLKQLTGGAVGGLQYIEQLQDTFNMLSKVGAGGAGDLGELQRLAGEANLALPTFANLVAQNSELLAGFAGGVDAGKRRFVALNKELYDTGLISQFKNLGFSSEEASEFVLTNMDSMRRSARLQGLTDAEQVAVAADLAKNLSVVAKLTGKDAKGLQDEMVARQRDGATIGAIRLKEMNGAANAAENYDAILAATSGLPKVAQDLIKDQIQLQAPLSEATQGFAAINSRANDIAAQLNNALDRGASKEEVTRLADEYAAAVTGFAATAEGARISTLAQVSGVGETQAGVLGELKPQIDALDEIISGNVTAMTTAGQAADAYLENVRKLRDGVDQQANLDKKRGPGQVALNFVNEGQVALAEASGTINEDIGRQVQSNTALVSALNSGSALFQQIPEKFQTLYDGITAVLPGIDQSELVANLEANLGQMMDGPDGPFKVTQDLIDRTIASNDATKTGNEQQSLLPSELFDADGNMKVNVVKALGSSGRDSEGTESVESTAEEAKGFFSRMFGFDSGTLGKTGSLFKDFGAGMPAMLHGLEAVIPKDSPQGELLGAFPSGLDSVSSMMQNVATKFDPGAMTDQMKNMMQTGGIPLSEKDKMMAALNPQQNTSSTGTTSEDGIESLNMTMKQLVQINSRQLQELQKQLKAVKGMDGNVLTNVGI
jgi:hypothetical protein